MSDEARWDAAKRLFHAALDLPPPQREAFLRSACGEAPALLAEVQSLLAWHGHATGFLETPVARVAAMPPRAGPSDPLIGQTLGAWRVIDLIGRGGMGTVYKAERADAAFERLAALKVVGTLSADARFVERFRRERETLAALDHPNIARLLDGGTTPDGRPFFVMELVSGVAVHRYCDQHRLGIDQRLKLFRSICAAVQFAHQNLVVHRDLKPDNILVTDDGTPKLLDFGLATLASGLAESAGETRVSASSWLLTPAFASPEQVLGGPVTTASDVYSLGVLLYVLLTGQRPYVIDGTTPAEVQAQLAAATPRRPSDVVRDTDAAHLEYTARWGTPARQLAATLAGDLDAIVLRAISRDISTRYATVEQLVDDLDRYQSSYPVSAREPRATYVAGRFLRRHRVVLTATVLLLALVGAAGVAIVWQARAAAAARVRAERRFEDVRTLARTFMFDVHDAIVNVPGTTAARALMVRTAVTYLDSLAREAAQDTGLQRELATAYVRVGDAQGHPTSANLGDTAGARTSYERALAITGHLLAAAPDDVEAARTEAVAHRRLADVLAWTGTFEEALDHESRSRRALRAIAERATSTLEDRLQAGIAEIKAGDLRGNPNLPNLGRPDTAAAHYHEALTLLERLDADVPGDQRVQRFLGIAHERLGTLHELAGRWPAARDAYQASFAIRRALADAAPLHTDIQRDLGIAYEKLGNVQRGEGDLRGALAHYQGALAQFERLARADPSNVGATRTVAISREKVGETLLALHRGAEALPVLRQALEEHRRLDGGETATAQSRCDVARVAELLGDALRMRLGAADRVDGGQSGCASWADALAARRTPLAAGPGGCASDTDVERLVGKLRSCR